MGAALAKGAPDRDPLGDKPFEVVAKAVREWWMPPESVRDMLGWGEWSGRVLEMEVAAWDRWAPGRQWEDPRYGAFVEAHRAGEIEVVRYYTPLQWERAYLELAKQMGAAIREDEERLRRLASVKLRRGRGAGCELRWVVNGEVLLRSKEERQPTWEDNRMLAEWRLAEMMCQ